MPAIADATTEAPASCGPQPRHCKHRLPWGQGYLRAHNSGEMISQRRCNYGKPVMVMAQSDDGKFGVASAPKSGLPFSASSAGGRPSTSGGSPLDYLALLSRFHQLSGVPVVLIIPRPARSFGSRPLPHPPLLPQLELEPRPGSVQPSARPWLLSRVPGPRHSRRTIEQSRRATGLGNNSDLTITEDVEVTYTISY
ncbi:hypothetical protein EDB83DRAFT_2317359 [Lactarius deliciosus]|nr:hypothetical protein EDB83DRAFT_2317359 [Lactarius deliciosus]